MDEILMRVQKKKKKNKNKNCCSKVKQAVGKIKKKPDVKVVYISNPMKVNTSASEFRALVQELTGQDSDMPNVAVPLNSKFRDHDVQFSVGGTGSTHHHHHHQEEEEEDDEEEEVNLIMNSMASTTTATATAADDLHHRLLTTATTATGSTSNSSRATGGRSDEMSHESDLSFETFDDDDDAMLINMPHDILLANNFFPSAAGAAPYIV